MGRNSISLENVRVSIGFFEKCKVKDLSKVYWVELLAFIESEMARRGFKKKYECEGRDGDVNSVLVYL